MKLITWHQHVLAEQPERRALEQQTGLNLRRTNRLTELLIGGALACLKNQAPLPHNTALIVCSRHGALSDCKTAIKQVMADNSPPMPFTLMNTQHNMALLHLANALALQPQQTLLLSATPSAFVNTLWLAQHYLDASTTQTALIGFVDEDGSESQTGECSFFYVNNDTTTTSAATWQIHCEIKLAASTLLAHNTLVPDDIWSALASPQTHIQQAYPLSATQHWQLTLQKNAQPAE
ncbi:MAG: hypothetical protein H0W44_04475 [Gammaproteobacteria bacterium]|nr:hypothetical protein [Gammaproteobacteria bacterium]